MPESTEQLKIAVESASEVLSEVETLAGQLRTAATELPAAEIVAHLSVSTTQLTGAEVALQGAVEKADEAQIAAAEIGQEGMTEATDDLYKQLTGIHEQLALHRSTSEEEQASADVYAKKQLGN